MFQSHSELCLPKHLLHWLTFILKPHADIYKLEASHSNRKQRLSPRKTKVFCWLFYSAPHVSGLASLPPSGDRRAGNAFIQSPRVSWHSLKGKSCCCCCCCHWPLHLAFSSWSLFCSSHSYKQLWPGPSIAFLIQLWNRWRSRRVEDCSKSKMATAHTYTFNACVALNIINQMLLSSSCS